LAEDIKSLIQEYHIDEAVIEEQTILKHRGSDVTTFMHVLIRYTLKKAGAEIKALIAPTHWRKVLGFDQRRGTPTKKLKEQSLQYANRVSNKVIDNDNESDAVCVGLAYMSENLVS
jgi:hypothetical protein